MFPLTDTIVAPASAPGATARGIVRISGPDTLSIVQRCINTDLTHVLVPRTIHASIALVNEFDPRPVSIPLDLWIWPTTRSYTRQPLVELHLPGAPPLVAAAVSRLVDAGARLARAGEFTMRAFLAGRMDLIQAEAVLGVIDARDRNELGHALQQLAGGFSTPLRMIREDLLDLLADVEAGLDFVDEDIQFVGREELVARVTRAQTLVRETLSQLAHRDDGQRLPKVVLIGSPNAGKSRLFNALIGRDESIVSPISGTTRDFLRAELKCDGFRIELIDTAGHEESHGTDSPESIAQRQRLDRIEEADLCVICVDSSAPDDSFSITTATTPAMHIATKSDLPPGRTLLNEELLVSAEQGIGLDALRNEIAKILRSRDGEGTISTALRCREGLAATDAALSQAVEHAGALAGDEWIAADLRAALDELGLILGAVHTDDLLDRIFSRFCIGK